MAGAVKFNYRSLRASEARMTVGITPNWRFVLQWFSWLFILGGLTAIVFSYHFGWLIMIPGIVMWATYQWWRWRLFHLDIITRDDNQVDNILSSSILGRLSSNPTPRELAEILTHTSSGSFLLVRFGISPRFLTELSSTDSADMESIWKTALEIRQQTKSTTLSGGTLALALIKNFPNYEQVLAKLQLSLDDLIAGVRWHDYIHAVKDQVGVRLRTGGIARDWSFGYTPLIDQYGQNISQEVIGRRFMQTMAGSRQDAIKQMIDIFSGGARQNVALVGLDGVGKTTMVYALAEKLLSVDDDLPRNLRFRQIVLLDASAIVAGAPGRGELEKLVTQIFTEAYNAKNIIICFDNAHVFFEEGVGAIDLSNVLLPIFESGNTRVILTISEHKLLQINKRHPNLVNTLNRIVIHPTDANETIVAMQDRAVDLEPRFQVIYMYQAMQEAYRLSERYIHDLTMPGRAIRLLEAAAGYHRDGLVTVESVQEAIEKTMNVKIGAVNHEEEREMLLNLEQLIHERMINQDRAVNVVSDALRRARAGVRSQGKPIGTFMFLGPTGVGKTELAKSLAAVYFGGESSIIRLDMNEFVTVNDVARLLEDGAKNPHSLTAQVMQRPFSVVLLDEIEKAHPAVLSTLLQLLDEGILRDENNREVSFRDAIIITTSNAGAHRIREYVERGYEVSKFEKQFIDELISSNQFRPEFINRFDEIVVFRPLTKPELMQILGLIIKGVNKNLVAQKVAVEVTEEAMNYLVEVGYDPRLGARPMRRMVQSTVENIVAREMIARSDLAGVTITVTLDDVKNIVERQREADSIAENQ
ncbi:MAG: AAA family ATPase [Candidatus Nanosyncoccaceae bacterium]|jgi:ATP-dependent Clp protease ATP-binding subunit ClpC